MKKISLVVFLIIILLIVLTLPVLASNPKAPEHKVLNTIIVDFQDAIFKNIDPLKKTATKLFFIIVGIDIILAMLLNLGNNDVIKVMVTKVCKYSFVYSIILYYKEIINKVLDGFIWIGVNAGAYAVSVQTLSDPAEFTNLGNRLAGGVFTQAALIWVPGMRELYFFLGLVILLSILSIAINFFITYLEFYVMALVSLVLIPFGANKYTGWIGQKLLNMLFSFGVKLMILSFLAAVSIPILQNWALPTFDLMDPGKTLSSLMYLVFGSLALGILSWHAPNLAMTLLNGSPALTAGSVTAPIMSTASSVVTVGGAMATGGASLGIQGATGASSAVANAARIQNAK